MKKYFFFAAAALVALAACSKIEVTDTPETAKKISFEVAKYMAQTKADETSFLTELSYLGIAQADASFNSVSYIHADNGNGGTADPVLFFTAATNGVETVKYTSGSPAIWEPSHTYYWPKSPRSNLDFFSWYNYTGTNAVCAYDGTDATLEWTNRTVALKDNVMWADAAWHYTQNPTTGGYYKDNVNSGVPTLFHHALAQVRFTAALTIDKVADSKTDDKYTFWEVKLSNVSIAANTVKNNGNLKLTQATKAANGTQAWTLNSATATNNTNKIWEDATSTTYATIPFDTDAATGTVALTTTPAFLQAGETTSGSGVWTYMPDNYVTVRPQAVGDNIILTFKYTIKTYYGTEAQYAAENHEGCNLISTEVINVNDYGPAVADLGAPYTNTGIQLNQIGEVASRIAYWQMNYKYTYNILINPQTTKIYYDPAVEAWSTASATQTVPTE